YAHLDRDLSGPKTGANGRHPLPDPQTLAATFGRLGIASGVQVVAYDQGNGMFASRLWWLLRWVGHDAVAVLDGGFAKWTAEGRPVTSAVPQPKAGKFPVRVRSEMAIDVAALAKALRKRVLLDARAPARYRGEQEPIDPVAGRIPGALNRFNMDNVRGDGRFKSPEDLERDFQQVLGSHAPAE